MKTDPETGVESNAKVAPENRDRDGQCPGMNCGICYLRPLMGRCPFLKQE